MYEKPPTTTYNLIMSLTLANLNAAITGGVVAANAPIGYNGNLGTISLHKPTDYVGIYGKIVLNAGATVLDVAATIKYIVWIAQGMPDAQTPLTEEHMNAIVPRVVKLIARMKLYTLLSYANIAIDYRMSDTATIEAAGTGYVTDRTVNEMYHLLTESNEAQAKIAEQAHLIILSFFANAIHRKQNDEHSWFTDDTARRGTNTNRCCDVAGASKRAFVTWMASDAQGHDSNHHMVSACLYRVCDILSGVTLVNFRAGGAAPVNYEGQDVGGMAVHSVVVVGEAATDRWPTGQLGKAGMIVGIDMTVAMITNICMRLKVSGVDLVTANGAALSNAIKDSQLERSVLTSLNSTLQSIISISKGYVVEAGIYEEDTHKAFDSHAGRLSGKVANGVSLAQAVAAATPHSEAVAGAVKTMVSDVVVAFSAAAAIATGTGNRLVPAADVNDIDLTAVTVEVGVSNSDAMMKAMMSGGLGNNGAAAGGGP